MFPSPSIPFILYTILYILADADWYEDYSKISGEGNTWVWTCVMRYTD